MDGMRSIQKHALLNGRVRTMDAAGATARAVLVAGGRIEAVGSDEEIRAAAGKDARITDLRGKALYPGFIDSHSHFSMYSGYKDKVYCGADAGSVAGVLKRLADRVKETPAGELVVGWGYDDTILPENRGLTRKELDAISPRNPLLVIHMSAHVAYANSAALALAGLGASTVMEGGEVVLGEDGEPTGALLEMAAFKAMGIVPSPKREQLRDLLKLGQADYNAQGFTGSHEAGVGLGGIDPKEYFDLLQEMEASGDLTLRMYLSFMHAEFERFAGVGMRTGFGGPMIRFCGPKVFNDGSIQLGTAALLKPYHHRPDFKGELVVPADRMKRTLIKYHCDGYQIAYHGNGDAGIECMIAAIEEAQKMCPRSDPRHIILHCQTVSDAQLERMRDVGIAPSFFGLHVWYYGDRHYEVFLGPERTERIDPSGSAVRLGMKHTLHADSPVLPPLSLRSIHTAVNRVSYNGRLLGPDQRISVEEAVRAYTSHAAWFQFAENERGTIEPGKLADFVLLSDDLLEMDPERIADATVLMTMLGGRVVYGELPHEGA